MDPLTDRIIYELNRFRDLIPAQGFGKPQWTAGVKNALCIVGRRFGHKYVNAVINDVLLPQELQDEYQAPNFGEFIYDLSIQTEDKDGNWSNVVIAECEWNDNAYIKEDFEKLVVGRATLRVMVYDNSYANPTDFIKWIDLHQGNRPGDTYLLAAYQGSAEERLPLLYRRVVVGPDGAELVDVE